MERRSFIKNIGALAVVSQIGIVGGAAKKKEVFHNLVLRSSKGEMKMTLLGIDLGPSQATVDLSHTKTDTICFKAQINECIGTYGITELMEVIYKPDENMVLSGHGYVVNYSTRGNEIELEFRVVGLMTAK